MNDPMSHWTGRIDEQDGLKGRRWHQVVQAVEHYEKGAGMPGFVLLGFPCDEGVRRNQGRTGAAEGPAAIRRACASLPDHFPSGVHLFDAGDIPVEEGRMEEAQQQLGQRLASLLEDGHKPIVLGGGHEVAWGTYLGLRQAAVPDQRIGIINIDAHFDLRKPVSGANSGTGFYQIAEDCRERGAYFRYCCLGIQKYGNTRALFEQAKTFGVHYHTAAALSARDLVPVYRTVDTFAEVADILYLSIDLDAFDVSYAPGVSAPNSMGLDPRKILPLLQHIMRSRKVAVVDIAELNPRYDIDNRTAKLAASLIFELLDRWI